MVLFPLDPCCHKSSHKRSSETRYVHNWLLLNEVQRITGQSFPSHPPTPATSNPLQRDLYSAPIWEKEQDSSVEDCQWNHIWYSQNHSLLFGDEYGPGVERSREKSSEPVCVGGWQLWISSEGDGKTDPTQVPLSVKASPGHHTCWSFSTCGCIILSHLSLDSVPCRTL